jgi:hypothetical protein
MDPVSLTYYAGVCSLLGWAGPKLGAAPVRLAIGAVVGLVSAAALPQVKTWLGLAEMYSTIQP